MISKLGFLHLLDPVIWEKVYWIDTITNIYIKPNSCIDPSITKSVFKGFLHRTHLVCSRKYIEEETKFLVDMFVKNGCKRTFLETLFKDYNAKTKNKKNNDSHKYTNSNKIPCVPNIGPKIMKEFKKGKQRYYFHIWHEHTKYPMPKQTKVTT